ncbi:MAG: hypothetical protein MJD61_07330, partial [Proteobacteria bacterium]|nr:hypothetical protein [Pseudomonadota bacterium]
MLARTNSGLTYLSMFSKAAAGRGIARIALLACALSLALGGCGADPGPTTSGGGAGPGGAGSGGGAG